MSNSGKVWKSSIFKKQVQAVTGLLLVLFILVHLLGNLTLVFPALAGDTGGSSFIEYARQLHSLPTSLFIIIQVGLAALFLVHIFTGLVLFFQNLGARPKKYKVFHTKGGRTAGSSTMGYTGILVLIFLVVHLLNFTLSGKEPGEEVFGAIKDTFHDPFYLVFYVLLVLVLGLHLTHGIKSAFQTFGWNHPKYTSGINSVGYILGVIFGLAFAAIPVVIYLAYSA